MTRELQHAMAEYEEARIRYRKAVLSSLDGARNGEAIREAIRGFQAARTELARHGGLTLAAPPAPKREAAAPGWNFVRRLLHAG